MSNPQAGWIPVCDASGSMLTIASICALLALSSAAGWKPKASDGAPLPEPPKAF